MSNDMTYLLNSILCSVNYANTIQLIGRLGVPRLANGKPLGRSCAPNKNI